jgi:peptidoglycan hydrolase CwlO-like protein
MLGLVMPDAVAVATAALTSIAGALAGLAKDRGDRATLRKDVEAIKAQVGEALDEIDRLKARVQKQRGGAVPFRGSDPGIVSDLQRQVDDAHTKLDAITRRLDEHDGQWTQLQRELGGIGAKIEILLAGMR